MKTIVQRARIEWAHFQGMGSNLQRMLLVFSFYLAAQPMLNMFLVAYLWRQEGGALLTILYNLGVIFGLPLGFFINGQLLRSVHIKFLYFFGLVVQGLGATLAIFSTGLTSTNVLIYGLLYGFLMGFFWANRNTLDFQLSREGNRPYFMHLQGAVASALNVVMPFMLGWVLVLGEYWQIYDATLAYQVLMVFALILLLAGGLLIVSSNVPDHSPKNVRLPKPSPTWWKVRSLNFIFRFMEGLGFFVPSLLILYFGSREGVFGTVQSIAALMTAGAMYLLGRKMKVRNSPRILLRVCIAYCLAAAFLAWNFSWLSAVVYLFVYTIIAAIGVTSSYLIVMEVMDREDGVKDGKADYSYVLDNELFFNLGRLVSVSLFLGAYFISFEGTLRWFPLFVSVVQFLLLRPARSLVRSLSLR